MARKVLDGAVGKVSFVFFIISLIAWVIYIPFFGLSFDDRDRIDILYFPHWCFLFTGLILHTIAILHLLLGDRFSAVLLHFFNALYLASGGVIVYTDWVDQYVENKEVTFLLEFSASALSMISLTISIMLLPLIRDSSRSYATDQGEESVDARYLPQPISMVSLSAPNATAIDKADEASAAVVTTEKQDPGDQYEAVLPYQESTDLPVSQPLPEVYLAANIAADQDLYEDIHPVADNEGDDDGAELVYEDADENRTFHTASQQRSDRPIRTSAPSHEQLEAEDEYVVNEPVYADAEANALVDQPEEDYVINQLVYQEPGVEDYEALT